MLLNTHTHTFSLAKYSSLDRQNHTINKTYKIQYIGELQVQSITNTLLQNLQMAQLSITSH